LVICANPHTHDPLHLENTYFAHSFIDLNDFCCIRCAIWNFTEKKLKCKDNKVTSKDLKLQNSNWSYVPTTSCLWPLHLERHILLIPSLIWMIFFCIRCTIWSFTKTFGNAKTIECYLKISSSKMQIGHMCQPTSCHDPLHLEKTYLVHSFINLNDFCCIKCTKWRATKWFWNPKETKQCTKIYKFLSLKYQHIYPSSCN